LKREGSVMMSSVPASEVLVVRIAPHAGETSPSGSTIMPLTGAERIVDTIV
jgi:hypothetical protein